MCAHVLRQLGAIDFFISHSWSDDAALKYAKLVEVNRDFEAVNGRAATFWLDKVCIDQDNIQDALRCLPVFESECACSLSRAWQRSRPCHA
jgi:hypothetical protein